MVSAKPTVGRERPTARQKDGFDLSPAPGRASAAPVDRTEPCACGGLIVVHCGDSIPATVALHNASALHAEWRWRRSL